MTVAKQIQDVKIAADSDNSVITWWERNQTAQEPVMRISSVGPLLRLAKIGARTSSERRITGVMST